MFGRMLKFSMILDSLEVKDFRNLSGRISWGRGLNIIFGNNGQVRQTGWKPMRL